MKQKKTNNSHNSEEEIIDIDYQIAEAETKTLPKLDKQKSFASDSLEGANSKQLLDELGRAYKQIEEKDEQYNKIYSRYLRALADYENLEKRTRAERAKITDQANERLLLKLIDLADSFEKAEASMSIKESLSLDSVVDGFQAVRTLFNSILKNESVERIPAIGKKFDPNFHEVVFVKADPDSEEDTILEEVQIGYLLNSKVLRPTKVVIAKKKTKGED